MTNRGRIAELNKATMTQALLRSGYLMESRLVAALDRSGYFVAPNQQVKDAESGKSREIDFIAEYYDGGRDYSQSAPSVCVTIHFVCEAKNNPSPVVLLTELPLTPLLMEEDSLHQGTTGAFRHHLSDPSLFDLLTKDKRPFTQYCSFSQKGHGRDSEWMASHPEDFYYDLKKIVGYCRSEASLMDGWDDDKVSRLFFYLPVVILGGDLFVARPRKKGLALKKVDLALHMHFDIQEESQGLSLVLFVTERKYIDIFDKLVKFGQEIEHRMVSELTDGRQKA